MPRRGGSGGFRSPPRSSRGYSTAPPPKPASSTPKRQQNPSLPAQNRAGQPSMMRQIAATAGGVAIGTVLGHAMLSALSPRERVAYYEESYARASPKQIQEDVCGQYFMNLINCMKMAQEADIDVTTICAKADKSFLACRKENGDSTY